MRTLIVDDDFTSRLLLRRLLAPYGECDTAVSGWEALEAFKCAHAGKYPYDLICLDIMMPGLDGHEALREIRRLEAKYRIDEKDRAKVIMITALSEREHILAAAYGNCQAYVVKPISKDMLLEKLQTLGLLSESGHKGAEAGERPAAAVPETT